MSTHPLLNIAIRAARSASKVVLRAVDRIDKITVEAKGYNDFVTEVDKQSEQEIIQVIRDAYPDHAILAEESGAEGSSDYTWIIDPIDGTANFMRGHPHFCISIGVAHQGKVEHGLIYDPLRQEMFTASLGIGAFLNNRRIRVAQNRQLPGSLISASFRCQSQREAEPLLKILAAILPEAAGTRRGGSVALDCAYVAAGRLDGLWGVGMAPWDIAAGSLILREAGGIVTDFDGNDGYLDSGNLVAGNSYLHRILLQLIRDNFAN